MSQTWDVQMVGPISAGTLLHFRPSSEPDRQAMPATGDTLRFSDGGRSVEGNVLSRSAQTVDVDVAGHGVITIQPAPTYHPGRGSGTQNEVQILQWVIV
jgi:hypothetical protein